MTNFLVGPAEVGLENDLTTIFLPETAYPQLTNAYVFRGRVKRKDGFRTVGRLRRTFSNFSISTSGASPWSFNLLTELGISLVDEPDAQIELRSVTIAIGGGSPSTFVDNGLGGFTVSGAGVALGSSINYVTGDVVLVHGSGVGEATTVTAAYFPSLPVMGLPQRDRLNLSFEENLGFDTVYSYFFNGSTREYQELPSDNPTIWSGDDFNLFWAMNYQNAFWVTNNIPGIHGYLIDNISNGNPGVVTTTTNHDIASGEYIFIMEVQGMIEINMLRLRAKNPTPTTFELANDDLTDFDTTTFTPYTSGGVVLTPQTNTNGDGIRYYVQGGTSPLGVTWVNFNPPIDPTTVLMGALMLFSYRDRVVALNVVEGDPLDINGVGTRYSQRARWSQNGTAFYSPPVNAQETADARAWRQDIFGRGGFIDAPTAEQIVGAGFIRDTLVVAFERSTWKLRYTGNETLPFVWERVNTELGSEGTFSTVNFDKGLMFIGERGIVSSDGIDTERVDKKIPDLAFDIRNSDEGGQRVYGIREYIQKMVYWAYPEWNTVPQPRFPNRVLALNYEQGAYATFIDSFTCFDNFQDEIDRRWENFSRPEDTWGNQAAATDTWENTLDQSQTIQISAGNQQGYVHVLNNQVQSDSHLFIKGFVAGTPGIVQSPNHNLENNDFIIMTGILGDIEAPDADGNSQPLNDRFFQIAVNPSDRQNEFFIKEWVPAVNSFSIRPITIGANPYIGGGEIRRLQNFEIRTKPFNFFLKEDQKTRLVHTDFYTESVDGGEVTVDIFIDEATSVPANVPFDNPTVPEYSNPRSNVILTSNENNQVQISKRQWHRLYDQAEARFFQYRMRLSDAQMRDETIREAPFTLHAMIIRAKPAGRLI